MRDYKQMSIHDRWAMDEAPIARPPKKNEESSEQDKKEEKKEDKNEYTAEEKEQHDRDFEKILKQYGVLKENQSIKDMKHVE